jgi:septal ring factor EnvC (AmiA/AmiB activator)
VTAAQRPPSAAVPMPPPSERPKVEQELTELPAQIAAYQQELSGGQADKTRREWLEWHIRRVEKRMADIEARLAKVSAESGL